MYDPDSKSYDAVNFLECIGIKLRTVNIHKTFISLNMKYFDFLLC